ncbi:MAG: endolytic transglycosylase MltG [Xanthomonadaceae bacterium]|nr:endolytic transglycosylase MltG [Xanthomonadaceae bacterium]
MKRFVLVLLVILLAVVGWLGWQYLRFADAPLTGIAADASVQLERGDNLGKLLKKLRAQHVRTGQVLYWQVLARQTGAAGKLQVGEYALPVDITPRSLLQAMREGKVIRRSFTIVEGWNIRDLRAALRKLPLLLQKSADMSNAELMVALGHAGQHPEGRFLPETYAWTRGDSDIDILQRAYAALEKTLDAEWKTRAEDLPFDKPEQALTLASIIEKETGNGEERARIAGVFVRRLKTGMRLQTDPTVIYGMGSNYAGNIRRSDLTTDTPYNTYTRDGLPPTPIAMPGKAALHAATHPAPGDALYFVAVGDGSGRHVFSASLGEHNVAVRDYVARYRARQQAGKQ